MRTTVVLFVFLLFAASPVLADVSASPHSLAVEKGVPAVLNLTVRNHGNSTVNVSLMASGVPPDWVSPFGAFVLAANGTGTVAANVTGKEAGNWTLAVTATVGSVVESVSIPIAVSEPEKPAGNSPTAMFSFNVPVPSEYFVVGTMGLAVAVLLAVFGRMMRKEDPTLSFP